MVTLGYPTSDDQKSYSFILFYTHIRLGLGQLFKIDLDSFNCPGMSDTTKQANGAACFYSNTFLLVYPLYRVFLSVTDAHKIYHSHIQP